MKKASKFTLTILLVVVTAFAAVWAYSTFFDEPQVITITQEQPFRYANMQVDSNTSLPDLTFAAENSVHAVVHIETQTLRGSGWSSGNPLFDEFIQRRNQEPQLRQGFGSGVIISEDGFIVTNNHVIEDAENIKVILNDKSEYEAELVGSDSDTDIALLKVDAENLPYLTYGDSDALLIGEWVLAVGNPFNLTSTVTAGIVSARARNIGINRDSYSIESFIQTDAAVNPGNSGGALVNQQGLLVGINTAIASQTGSYAGYSFAVPASIVSKVVEDLSEFGEVQRGLLGVNITNVTSDIADEYDLDAVEGVLVTGVSENSGALEAGIQRGDVVLSVAGTIVNSTAELQEKVSQYRPGDEIEVLILRDGDRQQFNVTLRNRNGDTQIVRANSPDFGG